MEEGQQFKAKGRRTFILHKMNLMYEVKKKSGGWNNSLQLHAHIYSHPYTHT